MKILHLNYKIYLKKIANFSYIKILRIRDIHVVDELLMYCLSSNDEFF